MVPRYQVPSEIEELLRKGVFQELTRDGDPARNFGLVSKTGYEGRLWVDREKYGQRTLTGARYVVTGSNEKGELQYESSHNSLDWALDRWDTLIHRKWFVGTPKDWSPLKHKPKRVYE